MAGERLQVDKLLESCFNYMYYYCESNSLGAGEDWVGDLVPTDCDTCPDDKVSMNVKVQNKHN